MVVLAVASFSKIAPDELWVAFGVGSSFQHIAVHKMAASMNPTQCLTICIPWQRKVDRMGNLEVFPRSE